MRLSLQALETLAVIAYKQPVTVPEISEIRGVDSAGVIATLLDRKLITTAGRKQVIGRPILYKTTKEFLLRFGLNDVNELPSMEEFEKLGEPQADLFAAANNQEAESGAERPPEVSRAEESEPVTEAVPESSMPNRSWETAPCPTRAPTPPKPGALRRNRRSDGAVPIFPERWAASVCALILLTAHRRSSRVAFCSCSCCLRLSISCCCDFITSCCACNHRVLLLQFVQ